MMVGISYPLYKFVYEIVWYWSTLSHFLWITQTIHNHRHTGECLHIFGKHIFLESAGASGWSAPPVAWKHRSVGPSDISSWPRCRLSQEPHEGGWVLLNRLKTCMNVSMLGAYNGCIIWFYDFMWLYMTVYDCILYLTLLCINWRIAKQIIEVSSIFLAGILLYQELACFWLKGLPSISIRAFRSINGIEAFDLLCVSTNSSF